MCVYVCVTSNCFKSSCICTYVYWTLIRPTSGGRIGLVFSYNTEYWCSNIDLLKIYPLCHGDSFHPSLLLFLFDWWTKRWEIAKEMSMNYMACTYYVMLMAKGTCTWLHHPLKLLPSAMFLPCIYSNEPGWFHIETYMRALRLWSANTSAATVVIKCIWW